MKIINYIPLVVGLLTGLQAAPLTVDLTKPIPETFPAPLEGGTNKNPKGETITADNQSFFLNGKPWVPVMGEFHFSRYPHTEWREALLKMKAGGINVVATYVFWIHHEEIKGEFDWTGDRSLRKFISLCQEIGLKAFVRIGPFAHGEARNCGYPDWLLEMLKVPANNPTLARTTDPVYLEQAEKLYTEIYKQTSDLLWKNGGPIIGVQIDNESSDTKYLLTLKELAKKVGFDVPVYSMTGWTSGVPEAGFLPVYGGYSDGFWGGSFESYRRFYHFSIYRDFAASNAKLLGQFPYACCEIGPGMMSSYGKRIKIFPSNISSLTVTKLGSGNNMPGYYMYHGGVHPEGKLSWLSEGAPLHPMPVKDYDFQTAIGCFGQIREQYHLLRQQHLFLEDFGAILSRMPATMPDISPKNLEESETFRWCVRSDGTSGFIFYNNQQPYVPMPDHHEVQLSLKTKMGSQSVPVKPITIPSGSHGIMPFRLDCDGVMLEYATAQLLCKAKDESGHAVYFFTEIQGMEPELLFAKEHSNLTVQAGNKEDTSGGILINNITKGTTPAVTVANGAGNKVSFVILDQEQGKRLWRMPFAGRDYIVLSESNMVESPSGLRLFRNSDQKLAAAFFPQIKKLQINGSLVEGKPDGIFSAFSVAAETGNQDVKVACELLKEAGPAAYQLKGMQEATWDQAATYKLTIPQSKADDRILLNIHYIGDAARIYVDNKVVVDHFYNGDPLSVGLWRIPPADWDKIHLKILPYSDALEPRLPDVAKKMVAAAKESGTLNQITIDVEETSEVEVKSTLDN
jgi:beta-galactosidase